MRGLWVVGSGSIPGPDCSTGPVQAPITIHYPPGSMQIGVRQQREKARAVDRDRELALVARLGPGDARRDDLAVLVDEFLEDADVLVVDLLHLLRGEAAEAPAPEQLVAPAARVLALALGELALAFAFAAAARPAAATVTLSLHRHDLFLSRPCF